ncbi:DNA recombination protein RmuC [Desulfosarcina sp. OttesenSCG-928-A07]|nr:DNA recombination protein RmuC [Desulfosarcina sp. OttesenSCG-928-A07]
MNLPELAGLVGGAVGLGLGAVVSLLIVRSRYTARLTAEMRLFEVEKRGTNERLGELRLQLESALSSRTALETRNLELEKQIADLAARLETERQQTHEKILLLQDAREQLTTEFKQVSEQIFEEKGKAFSHQNQSQVDGLLGPLRQQLGEFRKRVDDVYDNESRDRAALRNEITHLRSLNERIGKDAINLTQALKGDVKTLGNWGEVILERVLESSGLKKGREYDTQVRLLDASGERYQPDVIVRLPDGRDVVVDAKVSLKAYEQYHSKADDAARLAAIKAHLASVRSHVKRLGDKHYEDLEGIRTLDFVLMFVPVEGAFLTALEHDREILGDAFEKNVILASPSTLLVMLRTICHLWRFSDQNENAMAIARQAGALHDKFIGLIEAFEEISARLDQAKKAFHTAKNRLCTGRGNLVQQVEQLRVLGAKVNKRLPDGYSGESDAGKGEVT